MFSSCENRVQIAGNVCIYWLLQHCRMFVYRGLQVACQVAKCKFKVMIAK